MRWCEWVPLSGFMTFLSEGIVIHRDKKSNCSLNYAVAASLCQTLSCITGGILVAYCPGPVSWTFNMTISVLMWTVMFPRVYIKRNNFKRFKEQYGQSFVHRESCDRHMFSYGLISTCTVVWTFLCVIYLVNALFHAYYPDHKWNVHSPAMIADTTFDVTAKAFYMRCILEVHFAVSFKVRCFVENKILPVADEFVSVLVAGLRL
jgi:hypothetical protein